MSEYKTTIQEAFGVIGECTTITLSNTTVASGVVLADTLYRWESDVDCSLSVAGLNQGTGVAHKGNAMTLYGGVPELFHTPADLTGDVTTAGIHVVASGINSTGHLHITRMKG